LSSDLVGVIEEGFYYGSSDSGESGIMYRVKLRLGVYVRAREGNLEKVEEEG
jgi:hypothetical protein